MASIALEEKINKIRLQNEEIRRRYEEVEADKKNAAKLDALKPVPCEDWPERKEPPEFSAPMPKHTNKPKYSIRKHSDQAPQYTGIGQGPPPDPKYNFLADAEREEYSEEFSKDIERNRGRNKITRGGFKRRGSGKDWHAKDYWNQHECPSGVSRPEYEAWRAERNRIDEARISRQRTAEGNWRREWDNNKMHQLDDVSRSRDNHVTLGDIASRPECNDSEKHYLSPRTAPKISHQVNLREPYYGSAVSETNYGSPNEQEKRVVIASNNNIKVSVNHVTTPPKSSVMSVKVSPQNIVGTGRVGPRQRPRVLYSSQEAEVSVHENPSFTRIKQGRFIEDKTKGKHDDQPHRTAPSKSPHPQRKRDGDPKSPNTQRKDTDRSEVTPKSGKKDSAKSPFPQRRANAVSNHPPKSPRVSQRSSEAKKDYIKLPHGREQQMSKITASAPEAFKIENVVGLECNAVVISLQNYNNDKANLLKDIQNNDKKGDSVSVEESSIETTASPTTESVSEIVENEAQEQSNEIIGPVSEKSPVGIAASSAVKTVVQFVENVLEKNASEALYGEPSTSQEARDDSNVNVHVVSTSINTQALNINADDTLNSNDSGFIESAGNDSGFIELAGNDSIHDISDNDIVETSRESIQVPAEIAETQAVIENLVVNENQTERKTGEADKLSSSDSAKAENNFHEKSGNTSTEIIEGGAQKKGDMVVETLRVEKKEAQEMIVDINKPSSSDLSIADISLPENEKNSAEKVYETEAEKKNDPEKKVERAQEESVVVSIPANEVREITGAGSPQSTNILS